MKTGLFLLGWWLWIAASGQRSISGTVVAEHSGQPVAGASIFINNSSLGAVANGQGFFELGPIPPGEQSLVVSSVGYETLVYTLTEKSPLKMRFEMRPKVTVLQDVVVGGYSVETWEKWGDTFIENFLGSTPNAKKCVIKNKDVLRFRYYKKQNMLEVIADEALKIENPNLGYTIQYDLQDFTIRFSEKSAYYAGYALFTDRENAARKSVQQKRQESYFGTLLHFARAVYENRIAEEGFKVRRMVRVPNEEKERVRNLWKNTRRMEKGIVMMGWPDTLAKDSVNYYNRVLDQKDFEDIYTTDYLSADSIIINKSPQVTTVFWDNYLVVTYRALESQEYLAATRERRKPIPQMSWLQLALQEPLKIDASGNWSPPSNVVSSGYWWWTGKVAEMLPLDYKP